MKFYYYVCEGYRLDGSGPIKYSNTFYVFGNRNKYLGFDIRYASKSAKKFYEDGGVRVSDMVVTFWKELTPQEYRMFRG